MKLNDDALTVGRKRNKAQYNNSPQLIFQVRTYVHIHKYIYYFFPQDAMRNTIQTGVPYQSKCTQSVSELSKRGKTNKTKTGVDLETVQSNTAHNWCRLIIYDSVKTSELLLNSRLPPPGVAHTRLGGGRLSFDNLLPFGGKATSQNVRRVGGTRGLFQGTEPNAGLATDKRCLITCNHYPSPCIFFVFLFFCTPEKRKKKEKKGASVRLAPPSGQRRYYRCDTPGLSQLLSCD